MSPPAAPGPDRLALFVRTKITPAGPRHTYGSLPLSCQAASGQRSAGAASGTGGVRGVRRPFRRAATTGSSATARWDVDISRRSISYCRPVSQPRRAYGRDTQRDTRRPVLVETPQPEPILTMVGLWSEGRRPAVVALLRSPCRRVPTTRSLARRSGRGAESPESADGLFRQGGTGAEGAQRCC
jgi:hypothetical protein